MKTLIILRHATADPPPRGKSDFERPLSTAGRQEAVSMSARLTEKAIIPDWILASAARRTRETAEIFARQQNLPTGSIQLSRELYNASQEDLSTAIIQSEIPETKQTLLLVAHNPGISEFAGAGAPQLPLAFLPPAGMVAVQLNIRRWIDWFLSPHTLLFFDYPNYK